MTDAQIQAFVRATAKPVKVDWSMLPKLAVSPGPVFYGTVEHVRRKLYKLKPRGLEVACIKSLQEALAELPGDIEVKASYYVNRVRGESWDKLMVGTGLHII